jgi:hypothetical protein
MDKARKLAACRWIERIMEIQKQTIEIIAIVIEGMYV